MINFLKKILNLSNIDHENIELIRNSKYFDEKYYLLDNPNVKGDPCKHYYYYGWKEGASPSFDFSTTYYLKNNKDVADSNINPLLHYLKYGESENRTIEKDNGLSFKKTYEKIYKCHYFYKFYIEDIDIRRINILFDKINESVLKMYNLFDFVIKYSTKFKYKIRIIYSNADFEILKKCLEDHNLKLPENVEFLNLKTSNYLEIGKGEKFICTSWKTAKALLNSKNINEKIYFYINNIDENSLNENYNISNICNKSRVITLIEDEKILKKIKKYKLNIKTNHIKYKLKDTNQLYCDFGDLFIEGLEMINEVFLNNYLKSSDWIVNVVDYKNDFKFHFDTNVNVRRVKEIGKNMTFMIQFFDEEREINSEYPVVQVYFKKEENKDLKYISILSKDAIDIINKEEWKFINNNENELLKFKKIIQEIEEREYVSD